MEIVYALIIIIVTCAICVGYYRYTLDTHIVRVPKGQVMEFKTSMELTGLPIITFYQGKESYNFLLDTGSNVSYVNEASNLEVTKTGIKDVFVGAEGKDIDCEKAHIKLYRNTLEYECEVSLANLEVAFGEIKNCYGVPLSGILGNDFFTKYKYCLDFKELVAYIRK